jgi:phosphatidate cytidylyltransferase
MLRWRLTLGMAFIGLLVLLCWLDWHASMPGIWLLPLAVLVAGVGADEVVGLAKSRGLPTCRLTAIVGTVLIVLAAYLPIVFPSVGPNSVFAHNGTLLALALGVILAILAEMVRYRRPGEVIARLAVSMLAMVYVGVLMGFVVQLRNLFPDQRGLYALVSLIAVVKLSDIGAYTVGRLLGKHKMAPTLSPGKTWEGAAGGVLFSCVGAYVIFRIWLTGETISGPGLFAAGWLPFGVAMAASGMLGDLAESLLKRDAGRKDSSTWMPGFGGVMDLLDSILLAAPVAYLFWAAGWVAG